MSVKIIGDELADFEVAIDAGNEFQVDLSFGQQLRGALAVPGHCLVLVTHGPHRDELPGIFQRAGERVFHDLQFRARILFRKSPNLPAGGDRRIVVEIHLHDEIHFLAAEAAGQHHPGFGVAAEAGTVGHLDPFVMHQRLLEGLERLR
jgi:hypothetical protein